MTTIFHKRANIVLLSALVSAMTGCASEKQAAAPIREIAMPEQPMLRVCTEAELAPPPSAPGQTNNPAASKSTDSNSKAIYSEERRRIFERAALVPCRVPNSK